MTDKKQILQSLPREIGELVEKLTDAEFKTLEEIRLRQGRPVAFFLNGQHVQMPVIVTTAHIELCMQKISKASVYAFMEEIRNGFITLEGGHRVGLCGRTVMQGGEVHNLKNISGINIRIARQIKGCADLLIPKILCGGKILDTLLISPPQCGKTTMLRDIARQVGRKHKVSVIDERGEIAAVHNGVPQYEIGEMTDVIDLCPKDIGITLMLRSMSPDVILTDEIAQKDIPAVKQAFSCGVSVIATAHGDDIAQTVKRLHMEDIIQRFTVILLSRKNGSIAVEQIWKGEEAPC